MRQLNLKVYKLKKWPSIIAVREWHEKYPRTIKDLSIIFILAVVASIYILIFISAEILTTAPIIIICIISCIAFGLPASLAIKNNYFVDRMDYFLKYISRLKKIGLLETAKFKTRNRYD